MTKPQLVIDGVCHPYNFARDNYVGRFGEMLAQVIWGFHPAMNEPQFALSEVEWQHEWQPEEFIETMLLESETDVCCVHTLPIYDAFHDGLVATDKGATLKQAYPDRVLWYAGVDMFEPQVALEEARAAIDQGADGLKFYPARYVNGKTTAWFLDDDERIIPILELAASRGIQNVAIHKALPLGPVSSVGQSVDDVSFAANRFPELNFQIVHAGNMFVDETKFLLANHPNIYANMESTAGLALLHPKEFVRILTELLLYAGPERIIFASSAVNPHPQSVLTAVRDLQWPEDAPVPFGPHEKDLYFGLNLARLHGLDPAAVQSAIKDDRFTRERRERGLRDPWSTIRSVLAHEEVTP